MDGGDGPASGAARGLRAGVPAVAATLLAALDHALSGRGLPHLPVVLAVGGLAAALFHVLAERRRGTVVLLAATLGVQAAFHVACWLTPAHGAMAASAASGLPGLPGPGLPGPGLPGPGLPGPGMLAGHLAAALLTAALLAHGEAALWTLSALRSAASLLRRLLLPAPDPLVAVPGVDGVAGAPARWTPTGVRLTAGLPRRGPPAPAC